MHTRKEILDAYRDGYHYANTLGLHPWSNNVYRYKSDEWRAWNDGYLYAWAEIECFAASPTIKASNCPLMPVELQAIDLVFCAQRDAA